MAYLFSRDEGQETFYAKAVDGLNSDYFLNIKLGAQDSLFNKTINANKPLILDKKNILTGDLTMAFYEKFRLRNTLALPIYLRGRVIAILGIGNNKESFLFDKDDIDLLDIFTKQIAIAIENDVLMRKVESLEIKDALTGLYNESFIRNHLQEEIRRAIACQRPCAFILLAIDGFKNFEQNFGLLQAENALKRIGDLIKESVTEIDRVGRFGDDEFAFVLPEKNKRRAQGIAEDIRKKVDFIYSAEEEANKKITINAGVSENPVDGIEAEKLIARARELVNIAKREDRNRIVS
jgi:diguanylate cyclase (GGDEF)-like protein